METSQGKFKVIEGRATTAWPSKDGKYKVKYVDELTEEDNLEIEQFIINHATKVDEDGN